jgi:predicted metal-dependent phosphoesterase TrpH
VQSIVKKCIENGIVTLSITDHNSVSATEEALSLCSESGIEYIPGIEIDCAYDGTDLHLLGYHIDWKSKVFDSLEAVIEKRILDAIPQMIANLAKEGIEIDIDQVFEKSEGKPPSAELFAEVLLGNKDSLSNDKLAPYMEGGDRSDMPYINFYLDFFAQGKPAYVKIEKMSFHDAIKLVLSHGGIPIIAHPGMNFKGKEEKVLELFDLGAKGWEVFNNYHDPNQMQYFAGIAVEKAAFMTCGSDFHGKNKPLIDIGKFNILDQHLPYLIKSVESIKEHVSSHLK